MGALIEQGVAARAFPGEHISGDRALVRPFPQGVLAAAVDGLGHGKAAGDAAGIAIDTLVTYAAEAPVVLVQHCHRALRNTRGVVMSLASINASNGMMTWLGVGNVDVQLLRVSASPPAREALLLRGGVVGYQLPPLHAYRLSVNTGDLLIFTTDGIRSDFATVLPAADPLLRHQPVQEIADRLLARFGKTTDDALVLVIRYLGSEP
ncbi:MAG: SpoIIE family protein phosphatase [Methylococcales bacterium]|nr:SpoIIE family protein phosphatase [Methylococcales bacterium]